MSLDWHKDVAEFHRKFRPNHQRPTPGLPPRELGKMQVNLVREEVLHETIPVAETLLDCPLKVGQQVQLLAKLADGIADSIVVLLGLAQAFGIDLRPVWDEVHRANMAKEGGDIREDGKILKPEGWQPPDVSRIIAEQVRFEVKL